MRSKRPALDDRDRRGVWLALIGLVVLLGGLYVAGHFLLGNRLPTGTRIAGVGVGGLTPDEAAERLTVDLGPRTKKPLSLYFEDHEYTLEPSEVGLDLQIERSVAEAGGGRTWNPVRMLETAVGADRIDPVVAVDEDKLKTWVDRVADGIDVAAAEPRVEFREQKMVVHQPEVGREVQREQLSQLIRDEYVQQRDPIALPVVKDRPEVGGEEFRKALSGRVEVAVSAPITMRAGGLAFQLSSDAVRSMLSYTSDGGQLAANIDQQRLAQLVDAKTTSFRRPPRPATVVLRGGQPQVVADRPGRDVRTEGSERAIVGALEQKRQRVIELDVASRRSGFRIDDAKKLGIERRVSSYAMHYPSSRHRPDDQRRAVQRINGTVLHPGDVFGFGDAVGSIHGDVSPVATAVFNAAYSAGLEIVDRQAHKEYRGYFPAGRDATTSGGAALRIKNNTAYGVLIHAWSEAGRVHVELWGAKRGDVKISVGGRRQVHKPKVVHRTGRKCTARPGQAGFTIEVHRRVIRDGKQVSDTTIPTSYESLPTIRCRH